MLVQDPKVSPEDVITQGYLHSGFKGLGGCMQIHQLFIWRGGSKGGRFQSLYYILFHFFIDFIFLVRV